jgi:hypothetical protein
MPWPVAARRAPRVPSRLSAALTPGRGTVKRRLDHLWMDSAVLANIWQTSDPRPLPAYSDADLLKYALRYAVISGVERPCKAKIRPARSGYGSEAGSRPTVKGQLTVGTLGSGGCSCALPLAVWIVNRNGMRSVSGPRSVASCRYFLSRCRQVIQSSFPPCTIGLFMDSTSMRCWKASSLEGPPDWHGQLDS